MGIPTFFRSIISGNKRVIQGAQAGVLDVDYFFMDFNSIIYKEWAAMNKLEKQQSSEQKLEACLVQKVVERTIFLVNEVVQPRELVFLSMDGPAPRAKMVQQRSRRFKSVQSGLFLEQAKKKLGGEDVDTRTWDPSCHICPGTPFMDHLSRQLQRAMVEKRFRASVLLSDGNHPGEGEHKILPRIRALRKDPKEMDKTVVIYSPDGDMISLGLLTHKSHIFILRYIDELSEHENFLLEKGFELLYLSLDLVREDFSKKLSKTYQNVDETRVLLDYNFLLAMVGNDFVPSLPFLKIRSGGLDILISLYNRIRPRFSGYLVDPQGPSVHMPFFRDLILELSKMENAEMRKEYSLLEKEFYGNENQRRKIKEAQLTPYQVFESRYYHMCLFHPDHPLAKEYRPLFRKIDYSQEKHLWKGQYYQYFCGLDPQDFSSYNRGRSEMVKNYLESLMFTLYYYTRGCPSWSWYYRHRVAPIPSDVLTSIDKFRLDINALPFTRGEPYTPYQQLMLILPSVTMKNVLPPAFQEMALSDEWKPCYPNDFSIDALAGSKYIYSEAILPEIEKEDLFLDQVRDLESRLSEKEKKKNRISTTMKLYRAQKK